MHTTNTTERTGVAWYVFHLVKQLAQLCPSGVTFRLYVDRPLVADFYPLPPHVEVHILRHPLRYAWTHTRLAYELWRHPVDVLFVPSHVLPLFCRLPMVMTIHDVAALHLPQTYSLPQRWYTLFSARFALKKAQAIIVPSQATKKDLEQLTPHHTSSVHVIPLAVDTIQHTEVSPEVLTSTLAECGISAQYFLFVGRLESKKNVQGMLAAFERFRSMNTQRVQLVLVGKRGVGYDEIVSMIAVHPYKTDIILRDTWVSQETVQALFTGATACVYPSLYEGFGLNVLDSLLYGVPVIVSNAGSLSEIGDEYVLRIDATDTASIADAMTRVCADADFRVRVKQKGPEYVKTFTWRRTAEQTLQVLLDVVS